MVVKRRLSARQHGYVYRVIITKLPPDEEFDHLHPVAQRCLSRRAATKRLKRHVLDKGGDGWVQTSNPVTWPDLRPVRTKPAETKTKRPEDPALWPED